MKIPAAFCDLCACEGELVLAVARYRGQFSLHDACADHAEEVDAMGMPVFPLKHPGDVDPEVFS